MTTALMELMGFKFNIPDYQRGYRWEEQEVRELLDDLWDFSIRDDNGDFYCLQPIVLQQNNEDSFDVLDGQQRLTTLYILLVYLEDMRKAFGYNKPLFSLNYTTRKDCEEFLTQKKFVNGIIDNSNIDFFHICNAYKHIDNWFNDEKHETAKRELLTILLDETVKEQHLKKKKNVRVIKYIVERGTNPIEVFIRLNIGKIPLTDAELTKALLLQSDKYSSKELEYNKMKLFNIATEWDRIENTLQKEDFWGFLNDNTAKKETHIEFIFDLIADTLLKKNRYFDEKPKKYSTFLIFSQYLENLMRPQTEEKPLTRIEAVEKIWGEVVEYFEYFEEWYQNRILYHYIGFLLTLKDKRSDIIGNLILQSKVVSKTKFLEDIESKIGKIIKVDKPLVKLRYGNDDSSIHKILLIHNVYSTMKGDKENSYFPFNLYKQEKKWSLEHIHAQNSENIKDSEKQKSWINDHIQSFSKSEDEDTVIKKLVKELKCLSSLDKIDQVEFNNIVGDVDMVMNQKSGVDNENMHSVSNLCLLDSATNSQLNNSVFDVKREKIKKRESMDFYIPICTRNVFLKTYTEYPKDNIYWTEEDRDAYLKSIQTVYDYFTKSQKEPAI